jgi:hypothetical protein
MDSILELKRTIKAKPGQELTFRLPRGNWRLSNPYLTRGWQEVSNTVDPKSNTVLLKIKTPLQSSARSCNAEIPIAILPMVSADKNAFINMKVPARHVRIQIK